MFSRRYGESNDSMGGTKQRQVLIQRSVAWSVIGGTRRTAIAKLGSDEGKVIEQSTLSACLGLFIRHASRGADEVAFLEEAQGTPFFPCARCVAFLVFWLPRHIRPRLANQGGAEQIAQGQPTQQTEDTDDGSCTKTPSASIVRRPYRFKSTKRKIILIDAFLFV